MVGQLIDQCPIWWAWEDSNFRPRHYNPTGTLEFPGARGRNRTSDLPAPEQSSVRGMLLYCAPY